MYQVYTYTVSELYSLFDNGRIKLKAPSDRTLSNEHVRLLIDGIFCGYPTAPLVIVRGATEIGEPVIKVLQGAFILSALLGYRKGSIRSKGYLSFKSVSERSKNGDSDDFIRLMNYGVPVIALSDVNRGDIEATLRLIRAIAKHE